MGDIVVCTPYSPKEKRYARIIIVFGNGRYEAMDKETAETYLLDDDCIDACYKVRDVV